jgi:hypothetical protein
MYVQLTLNSKGIWMVRPSLFYSVISFSFLNLLFKLQCFWFLNVNLYSEDFVVEIIFK